MLLDELEAQTWMPVARLESLCQSHRNRPNYTRTVAEAVASGSAELERSGGWLLRREVEVRGDFPTEDWMVIVDALPGVRSWAGQLQLCQLLSERPSLMDAAPPEVAQFLRGCTQHPKPTVRAWAVTAFHELGRRDAQFRAEARRHVAAAGRDPAKCMQARLRHLR